MPDRPNVLIFMMDTQRLKNMSCYGYRRETTPSIDRIAEEGVVFENHIITASWTLPVHASLFTGKYACGHGAHERTTPAIRAVLFGHQSSIVERP